MESVILRSTGHALFPSRKGAAAFLLLLGTQFFATPALADPNAPPGSITYIREVPTRRAYLPGEPGDVHAVRTAPTEVIFGALGVAAIPLTDEQAGAISAEAATLANAPFGSALDQVNSALGAPGGSAVSQLDANSVGNNMIGSIGSAIGDSTSAIQGAIGSVVSALPGMPK